MTKNIVLAASLPAPPQKLFDMYLNAREHAAFTGGPVVIDARAGATFNAFGGMLSGVILHVEPKRLIVQTWRSGKWAAGDVDSILVLTFLPEKDGARVELSQVNVPQDDFADICHGWEKYYWTPWRAYLEKK